MPNRNHFHGLVKGPVNRFTGNATLYDAKHLRQIWNHIDLGLGAIARSNSGTILRTLLDNINSKIVRDAANLSLGTKASRPIVDLLVVEVTSGKHVVFDTEAVALLILAQDALGRLLYQMRHQLGCRVKVGSILLKRFERAVDVFERFQKRRVN